MRVQIRLPQEAWEQLSDLAYRERRYPKQQAEYLILRALSWDTDASEDLQHQPDAPAQPIRRAVKEASAS